MPETPPGTCGVVGAWSACLAGCSAPSSQTSGSAASSETSGSAAFSQTSDACQDVIEGGTEIQVSMSAVARVPGLALGVNGGSDGGAITLWPVEEPSTTSAPTATAPLEPITLQPGERTTVLGRTI